MNMRWVVAVAVVAVLELAAIPVLAQATGPFGAGRMGMGTGMMGGGMMGAGTAQGNRQPISIERAVDIARQAIARSGYTGLVPGHIMEFNNHFYVAVKEKATGRGAYELLIDRYSGFVHPEPGPNMMWNTQYGHMAGSGMGAGMMSGMGMGGMMGQGSGPGMMGQPSAPAATPTFTADRAGAQAQKFLDARFPGAKTAEGTAFPGYYTIDVARNGKMVGMLSVNAYTGQIWYHTWHGTFVQEKDLE